jgi:CBS domain-containing protein
MLIVKDLMSHELYTLKPTDTVQQARELMLKQQIRHIPIVNEDNELLGLVSKRDVLAASVSTFAELQENERDEIESHIPIDKIMIKEVVIAEENTHLVETARFMLETKQGCLPVMRESKLVGILTEADFVRLSLFLLKKMADYENINH